MKALVAKKAMFAGSYVFTALLMEFLTFNFLGAGVFPEYFWLDVAILLLVGAVVFILPSFALQGAVIFVLLALQAIVNFVNQSLYFVSGTVLSIDMLSLGGEVASTYESSFVSYPFLFLNIFCVLGEVAFLLIAARKRTKGGWKMQTLVCLVTVLCIAQAASTGIFAATVRRFVRAEDADAYLLEDDRHLYDTLFLKDKAFRKFGTFAFYYRNFLKVTESNAPRTEEEIEADRAATEKFFEAGEDSATTPYTGALAGHNLVMVMIESGEWYGINEEYTPTLYALAHQGVSMTNYHARDKTNHSEAIGFIGSYPLESVLVKNGIYKYDLLGNDWAHTLPSVLKKDGYRTAYLHDNVRSFYGRATTHPKMGFEKTFFLEDMPGVRDWEHNPKKRFHDFDSDRLFFETMAEELAPAGEQPFFTFATTVTTHGNYDDLLEFGDYSADWSDAAKKEFSEKCTVKNLERYYEVIDDYPASIKGEILSHLAVNGIEEGTEEYRTAYLRYKRYQAALMDLDLGLEALIRHLDETGELSTTAILMYGDHTAYFSDQNYKLKGIPLYDGNGEKITSIPETYHVPLYLYDGSMPLFVDGAIDHAGDASPALPSGLEVDRFTCSFDIVPTVLDLFGYTFNRNLYQGTSAFSDAGVATTAFISRENGMFNDLYYTRDGEIPLFIDEAAGGSREGFAEFRKSILAYYERQRGLETMYRCDFFGADSEKYPLSDIGKLVKKAQAAA